MMLKKKVKDNSYKWKYCSVGGVVRVKISSGEDIAHLDELDQKMWTVLSCPVRGLEFDQKTLSMIDTDADGKIRVREVVAAAKWLCSVVRNKDLILEGRSEIALSEIDDSTETGARLLSSAKQVLSVLGLERDTISIEDTADLNRIFINSSANGDGVVCPETTTDEALKSAMQDCIATVGAVKDRSGNDGVDEAQVEKFYQALADYAAWMDLSAEDRLRIFPYGESTAAAVAAVDAMSEKIFDYFMRCKVIAFNADAAAAVDQSVQKIGEFGSQSLVENAAQLALCPLARPHEDAELHYEAINPAWQDRFEELVKLVLEVDYPQQKTLTESQWKAVNAKIAAYREWLAAKKGQEVEALGEQKVRDLLKENLRQPLLDLVAADKAVSDEVDAIVQVDKLLHLYRDFAKLLDNYVIFSDFYSRRRAVFEVGQLYIDQRCCDLCLKVEDMGQHAQMASLSGMFLIYCACTSKTLGKTMNIVAVMTDGKVSNLRPGKNAVFYDRTGADWDAVVTKVVDNPISIKDAFWSPYRKFANTIEERINKSIAEKDAKVTADMTSAANTIKVPEDKDKAKDAAKEFKPPFDIAKFAGIFAAVGMAAGMLGTALMKLIDPWHNVVVLLLTLILCISGPSMFIAWQKLRRRNLGPVLNANGWAINSVVLINIMFGATLTSLAKYPKIRMQDPFVRKRSVWSVIFRWFIILLVASAAILTGLYYTNRLAFIGLAREVETVVDEAKVKVDETAEKVEEKIEDGIKAAETDGQPSVAETSSVE